MEEVLSTESIVIENTQFHQNAINIGIVGIVVIGVLVGVLIARILWSDVRG